MVKNINTVLFIACLTISFDTWTHCELFSTVTELEPFIETQKAFIDTLEEYIGIKVNKLKYIKKCVANMKVEKKKIEESQFEDYFGDPINSYRVIKRLTTDLTLIEIGIFDFMEPFTNHKLPSQGDLYDITMALQRIQAVYNLSISDIGNGFLSGVYSAPLTTSDCYEIGDILLGANDFKNGVELMLLAYQKYKRTESGMYDFTKENIIEQISNAYHELEDYKKALEWLNRLLVTMKPDDPRYANNHKSLKYLEDRINQEELNEMRKRHLRNLAPKPKKKAKVSANDRVQTPKKQAPKKSKKKAKVMVKQHYETQCRGERGLSKKVIKRLKCRYLRTHPFLRLAPVKMEQLYIKPDIVMFHEVLKDHEIKQIVNISKPRLQMEETGDQYRNRDPFWHSTRKLALIPDNATDVIARLSRRVADITGFTTDTAEDLQVVNYGFGGHYQNHYDFCRNKTDTEFNRCGRLATVLFYLSEAAQGGATVFTELGLTVHPVKGAAVFWVNLHRSGEGDLATLHGACPVIHGSKWIANKWIQEAGQELIRPCTLEYQAEGILHKIQRPVRKKKYKNVR